MISLLFKFLGDSTPLRKEAEKAKGEMKEAGGGIGAVFGQQFKSMMLATIGLSAIMATVKKSVQDAMSAEIEAARGGTGGLGIRETQALARAQQATGLTREQILDTGRQNPEQFANFIKQFESPLGEADLQNMAITGSAVARGARNVGAQVGGGFVMAGQRIGGFFQNIAGRLGGGPDMQTEGWNRMMTGRSSGIGQSSPEAAFIRLSADIENSNKTFNEMVDGVNRMILEQEKTREAIERS